MTSESQDEDRPLMVAPIAGRKRGRKGPDRTLIIVGGVVGLVLGVVAIFVMTPQLGFIDALNGATPSLAEAKGCLRAHDLVCAEGDLRAYLRKYPKDARSNALLAITLSQDGQHEDALPYFKQAIALGVETYDTYANYAISLNTTGHLDDAIKMNYAALRLVPSLVDVRGALADQLVAKGKPQDAINLLDSFDQSLQDRGEPPYFETQIAKIRAGMGGPAATAQASATIPDPLAPGVAASQPGVATGPSEVPLQAEHGSMFVPVVINDAITLRFVVDSGATDVSIPSDVAQTLMRMGKLSRADYLGSGMAMLADGSRVPTRMFLIHSMKVGGHEVKNVTATVSDNHGVLLLGLSFLRHFKSWSIDNRRKVLVLEG